MKRQLRLENELKWSRVSAPYLEKYQQFASAFLREAWAGHVKVRVMFTQNAHVPVNLTAEQREEEFFRLYYFFVKEAFGLRLMPSQPNPLALQILFDVLPDTREKVGRFKGFIHGLQRNPDFRRVPIRIAERDLQEVDSSKHPIIQGLDVVLGAMSFRLNDKHLERDADGRKGNRTRAKETLYKHILGEIRSWKPRFNPGITTGRPSGLADVWEHPYRHWVFVPKERSYDPSRTKRYARPDLHE